MKGISLSFIIESAFIIASLSSVLMVHSSMAQQQQFTASTTAKQVVDAYKAGVPFKNYIAAAIKNRESPEHTIIKNQLGSGNTVCGGSDAATKATVCDGMVSFCQASM